jgi:hypothetical protein
MLRLCASFLLLILTAWLPMPSLLASGLPDQLPACCRQGGAHHRMMMEMMAHAGSAKAAVQAPCPHWKPAVTPAIVPAAVPTMAPASRFSAVGWIAAADPGFSPFIPAHPQCARAPPAELS